MLLSRVLKADISSHEDRDFALRLIAQEFHHGRLEFDQIDLSAEQKNAPWTVTVAVVIDFLCEQSHRTKPSWIEISSQDPIYIPNVDPNGFFASCLRQESPVEFSRHNIFVSKRFLQRA